MTTKEKLNKACKRYAELKSIVKPYNDEMEDIKSALKVATGEETTTYGTWTAFYETRINKGKLNVEKLLAKYPSLDLSDCFDPDTVSHPLKCDETAVLIKKGKIAK